MNSMVDRDFDITDFANPSTLKASHAKATKIGHVVAIAMLVFIMVAIFTVVWEVGVNRALQTRKVELENQIANLEEQHRLLRARLSIQGMPEELVRQAIQENLDFQRIDARNVVYLSGREG